MRLITMRATSSAGTGRVGRPEVARPSLERGGEGAPKLGLALGVTGAELGIADRWANETLQMAARRIPGVAVVRDPPAFSRSSGDGRLGYLLYKRALTRRLIVPRILRGVFAAGPAAERELLSELPPMLDRIDTWIADGILGGPELNAADFMVAPSLALILYRPDVMPMFKGRPALELVDRLLPDAG
jgi:glutathione S-transferase